PRRGPGVPPGVRARGAEEIPMSLLVVMPEDAPDRIVLSTRDGEELARALGAVGVRFERWKASAVLAADAGEKDVLAAYRHEVDRLNREGGYLSADVVRLAPDAPNKEAARKKFL